MLSDKIRNITRELRNRADDGTLTVVTFALALENLDDTAGEVAAIENAPVPAALRGDIENAGDNVVSFASARIERRRFGAPGDGDAA